MSLIAFASPGPLTADHTPTVIAETITSGTSVGVTVISVAPRGGVPPYTILWAGASSDVTINTSAIFAPNIFATGIDVEHTGTIVYIVTDGGGRKFTASIDYTITQGTPP